MNQQPPVEALASHLINQTLTSILLLEQLSLVSPQDAALIRSKLPHASGPFPSLASPTSPQQRNDLQSSFGSLNLGQGPSYAGSQQQQQHQLPPPQHSPNAMTSYQSSGLPSMPPPLPSRQNGGEQRARALWDYDGKEPDDLYFRAGDILIIDEEVNAQWYRGRVIPQGQSYPLDRQALFPSNYIEKLSPQNGNHFSPPPPPPGPQAMVPYQHSGPPVPQNQYAQKPWNNNNLAMAPPQPQQQMGMAPVQQEPPPGKQKFGSQLGNQLALSAAGGAGFGAGSALMGNLVNKIF